MSRELGLELCGRGEFIDFGGVGVAEELVEVGEGDGDEEAGEDHFDDERDDLGG